MQGGMLRGGGGGWRGAMLWDKSGGVFRGVYGRRVYSMHTGQGCALVYIVGRRGPVEFGGPQA